MVYKALISPQGHVEYNAEFLVGADGCKQLEHGKWYTNEQLHEIATGGIYLADGTIHKQANFLKDSSQSTEKNIKKWRFEIQ